MNRAIKYRINPTEEQKELFAWTFGCCRKVWNLMLDERETADLTEGLSSRPTPAKYKKEYPYLKEVDSLALANEQLALEKAYSMYFKGKGTGRPKHKSRKNSRASYTTNNQNGTVAIDIDRGLIRLPKAGMVRAKLHRAPEEGWKLKSATVSMTKSGSYYCAVLFEYEGEAKPVEHPESNAGGLDYKSDGLYADSEGNICGSPKYYRKGQQKLAKAQRKLRHKKKDSSNYRKASRKIAKENEHIANQRKDFLHKKSAEIANQYDMVCAENLDMKAMANKGFGNGKATLDNGYGMFLNMLAYKLADRGKVFVKIDKWYPSSQICSCCGTVHPEMKDLSVRRWRCPDCGAELDRDVNAAVNIKREGIREYLSA